MDTVVISDGETSKTDSVINGDLCTATTEEPLIKNKPITNTNNGKDNKEEITNGKKEKPGIDIPEVILLFQTLGFCLGKFEKGEEDPKVKLSEEIRVELSCPKSGMYAVLTKPSTECKCPSKDMAGNAELWNISGVVPGSQENINVSHSSLLPIISPLKRKMAMDFLNSALKIFNRKHCHQSEETFSISTVKSIESLNTEVDTNKTFNAISPVGEPSITSSPIPGGNVNDKIKENLKKMKTLVDQSIALSACDVIVKTNNKRRISDIPRTPSASGSFVSVTSKGSTGPITGRASLAARPKFLAPNPRSPKVTTPRSNTIPSLLKKDTPMPKVEAKTSSFRKSNVSSRYLNSPTFSKAATKIPSTSTTLNKNKK